MTTEPTEPQLIGHLGGRAVYVDPSLPEDMAGDRSWSDVAAPAGTGSPTPAPGWTIPAEDLGGGRFRYSAVWDGEKYVQGPPADYDRVTFGLRQREIEWDGDAIQAALHTIDNLRAELSQVQKERDALARRVNVRYGEFVEQRAEAAQMRDERDEARAALAALRTEVGRVQDLARP